MQKKYKVFLFDADDTLFDYKKCEEQALNDVFKKNDLKYSEEIRDLYSDINSTLWKKFEKGEVTKHSLQTLRFSTLFEKIGITGYDGYDFNTEYINELGKTTFLIDGAYDICKYISDKHIEQYIITNGISSVQRSRFSLSKLKVFFPKIYISEEIGHQKPKREFFDFVLSDLPSHIKEDMLIIGDSLSSDIKGGENSGIDTCYFNPNKNDNLTKIKPTYEISRLDEITKFI